MIAVPWYSMAFQLDRKCVGIFQTQRRPLQGGELRRLKDACGSVSRQEPYLNIEICKQNL